MPSKIEWCEETWNPVTGCTHVSEGCRNCYAERMSGRLAAMGQKKYSGITAAGKWSGVVRCHDDALTIPLRWKRPRVVFVNSMSDTFHPLVPAEFIHRILDVCERCPQHRFLFLTKRPVRIGGWRNRPFPKNVGVGTSCEDQKTADTRIPHLLSSDAPMHFLSMEPLLGAIDVRDWSPCGYYCDERVGHVDHRRIDWMIVGCESGPNRRAVDREWLVRIIGVGESERIPVFVKQWDFGQGVVKLPHFMGRQYLERPEWFFAKCG